MTPSNQSWQGKNSEGDIVTITPEPSDNGDYCISYVNNDEMGYAGATIIPKAFIQSLLAQQKREMVGKIQKEKLSKGSNQFYRKIIEHYNLALDQAIKIIREGGE